MIRRLLIVVIALSFGCKGLLLYPKHPMRGLPPEPLTQFKRKSINTTVGVTNPVRSVTLYFDNVDIGPLYFQMQRRDDATAGQWTNFAEGVAMPGTTRIKVAPTNASGFFRVGWK